VIGAALLRTPAQGATLRALRLAVIGLLVTGIFGSVLAEGLAGRHSWPLAAMAGVHAAWGLGGWALTLLAGVSYLVVPMFQLTPQYPQGFARLLPIAMLLAAAGWSAQLIGVDHTVSELAGMSGVVLAAAYGAVTLWLQARRRRRVADPTFWFFRLSMIALLAIPLSAVAAGLVPGLAEHPRAAWWFGVLTLVGVFASAINGMAYKIVPFLNWLHLQRLLGLGAMPPNMKDMIPERAMVGQLRVHAAAVAALLAATFWPMLAAPAGLLFAASCAWLGGNLIRALRVYLGVRDRIGAGGAGSVP